MNQKLSWGVLGAARIATQKVIPAMQRGEWSTVAAIASRDLSRAEAAARALDIPKAYGSYEAMLADPDIEAIYNPLPNHLHVPMTSAAAAAGKHVLCEKPIAITANEAEQLKRAASQVMIAEAFMVRHHPQWHRARDLIRSGEIGDLRAIHVIF